MSSNDPILVRRRVRALCDALLNEIIGFEGTVTREAMPVWTEEVARLVDGLERTSKVIDALPDEASRGCEVPRLLREASRRGDAVGKDAIAVLHMETHDRVRMAG